MHTLHNQLRHPCLSILRPNYLATIKVKKDVSKHEFSKYSVRAVK